MSPIQKTTLDFVTLYFEEHGISPPIRTIASHLGHRHPGHAHKIVSSLAEYGYLKKLPDKTGKYEPATLAGLAAIPTERLRAELAKRERDNG